jgi:hypothetical protein
MDAASPRLEVPQPGEAPTPVVPAETPEVPDPEPAPPGGPPGSPEPPGVPEVDPDREAPIEPPPMPQTE